MSQEKRIGARSGYGSLRWIAIILAIPVFLYCFFPRDSGIPSGAYRASCQNNLKQFGVVFLMFSNEEKNKLYPPLSQTAGDLTFEMSSVIPEYLSDATILLCPDQLPSRLSLLDRIQLFLGKKESIQLRTKFGLREQSHLGQSEHLDEDARFATMDDAEPRAEKRSPLSPEGAPLALAKDISDTSYYYIGYLICSDDELAAFAVVYKQCVREKAGFTGDLSAPPGKGSAGDNVFHRLQEGVERFIVHGDNSGAARSAARATIPVMVERPGNHPEKGDGGNVLFLDGHVAYVELGEGSACFPMTPKAMKTFAEMDALGLPLPF